MRNFIIMATLITTLLACSPKENVYEQTIANHVQTDRHGTWTDLHFKVISLEAANCTVADSIKTLVEDATEKKEKAIARETKWLSDHKAGLEKNNKKRYPSQTIENMYRGLIEKAQHRLDSLQQLNPEKVSHYEGVAPDKVLAVYVTCKYGVTLPGSNTYKERTDTFVLTPDGKTVIGKDNRKDKPSHN